MPNQRDAQDRRYLEAIRRFQKLFARAQKSRLREPTAVALATADSRGRPSARMVLLKGADKNGFVFYTNLKSRKARQLAANPRAALCFFWETLNEQIIVEGKVRAVSRAEADAYWRTRPRAAQIGAWASAQSSPLKSRAQLLLDVARCARKFAGRPVPRPPFWSGFRLVPDRIEFWKRRPFRLNDRFLYVKEGRRWAVQMLYP